MKEKMDFTKICFAICVAAGAFLFVSISIALSILAFKDAFSY